MHHVSHTRAVLLHVYMTIYIITDQKCYYTVSLIMSVRSNYVEENDKLLCINTAVMICLCCSVISEHPRHLCSSSLVLLPLYLCHNHWKLPSFCMALRRTY